MNAIPNPNSDSTRLTACSSVNGKIEMMLLIFKGTGSSVNADEVIERYKKIFEAFGDRVTFVILACEIVANGQGAQAEFARHFESALKTFPSHAKHEFVVLGSTNPPDGFIEPHDAPDHWAQDPFVVLRASNGQIVLLEPMFHTHPRNALVAEQLASSANILLRPTRYFVEGGNILIGDDFALVGRALLERNLQRYFKDLPRQEAEEEVSLEFKHLLGVKYLYWVGFEEERKLPLALLQDAEKLQALFHIDLFLTLGGKDQESGNEIVFVANFKMEEVIYEGSEPKQWEADLMTFQKVLEDLAEWFRNVHTQSAGPQFQVETMPLGIVVNSQGEASVYSYNNAHVESFQGTKRIYLPFYPRFSEGTHALQRRVENRLDGLGYKYAFVDHFFERYSKYGHGSLHCLSKVLMRGEY